jgi:tetratricopeptide (TPR) repeat protein
MGAGFSDASMSANGGLPYGDTPNVEHNRREWRACGLQAELPGYTSEIVELIARTDNRGGNIGSIALHRIGPVEGNSISATSAAAPAEAREALEKGYEQVGKKKWDAARESFERAVQIYPQYAVAWFELGRVQMQKKDVAAAKHSFQQSLASDSHFASPYLGLTQIAVQEQRWQDIADLTSKLIALGSVNFPDVWYFSGVANYNLMKFSAAEKSVREGLRVDPDHHVPKLEYLLSVVLMEQHDYAGAREHMQNYLHLAINPRDVEGAQATLAEINRLSASATASAGNGKN